MNIDSSSLHGSTLGARSIKLRALFFGWRSVARLIRRPVGMSGVLREPRFWCFGRGASKRYRLTSHTLRLRRRVLLVAAVFCVWLVAVAHAPTFGAWATFSIALHRFLCIREPKKARQRNLRLAPVASGHSCGRWQ